MERIDSAESELLQARTGMLWQRFGEESVLLDLDRGVYYELNPVGTRVWQLLQEPRRTTEVQTILASEYEVDAQRCATDVAELIGDLRRCGMVRVCAA